MNETPTTTRQYINPHLDSTRWEGYRPRDDDVIVTTSYKSGTTFMQQILYNLLIDSTLHQKTFPEVGQVSPWVDFRPHEVPKAELWQWIDGFTHRRFLKSHLPLDGLPYHPQVKYIVVARDPRDVFMSLLNHYRAYTDFAYRQLEENWHEAMPRYSGDDKALWRQWIGRGWFEWEHEGYPFWGNMHHTATYWRYRNLPNVLLVHYGDLLADVAAGIRRVAEFIELRLADEQVELVAKAVSFDQVKRQAVNEVGGESDHDQVFQGGQATFINKGTNGRWRGFLDETDLQLYEHTRDAVLPPDCAKWLEQGGVL